MRFLISRRLTDTEGRLHEKCLELLNGSFLLLTQTEKFIERVHSRSRYPISKIPSTGRLFMS